MTLPLLGLATGPQVHIHRAADIGIDYDRVLIENGNWLALQDAFGYFLTHLLAKTRNDDLQMFTRYSYTLNEEYTLADGDGTALPKDQRCQFVFEYERADFTHLGVISYGVLFKIRLKDPLVGHTRPIATLPFLAHGAIDIGPLGSRVTIEELQRQLRDGDIMFPPFPEYWKLKFEELRNQASADVQAMVAARSKAANAD